MGKSKSKQAQLQKEEISSLLETQSSSQSYAAIEESHDSMPVDEWGGLEPTEKKMGVVSLVLDKGVRTTAIGTIYGLDFEIEEDDYRVNVFFDYYNRRLKILHYEAENYARMLSRLAYLAEANNFDKVFVKATHADYQQFLSHGYAMEGVLKYYFQGQDAYVLSRFTSLERIYSKELIEESELIEKLIYDTPKKKARDLDDRITIILADESSIPELVRIYREVFATYPSPLTNADYIQAVMKRNVIFRIALLDNYAVAAASADIDHKNSNAELTDCATVSEAQGMGLMQHLLIHLEKDLLGLNIMNTYTLARAQSYGMNCVFYRLDYEFSGRLINNCDIFGQFEDMNIWTKKLE
jgi:beta-lysine N6-acetyltransferase